MEQSTAWMFSFSLALSILIAMGVNGCKDIPSMDIASACRQASTSPHMCDLCTFTLHGVGATDGGDVLAYAVAAARAAAQSYGLTVAVCTDGVAGDAKASCEVCVSRYGEARRLVDGVVGSLRGCSLQDVEGECVHAVAAVDDCATAALHASPGVDTPLHAMALDDRDRTVLALGLISLFVKKN